jgi:hemolysin activation/secretion protein
MHVLARRWLAVETAGLALALFVCAGASAEAQPEASGGGDSQPVSGSERNLPVGATDGAIWIADTVFETGERVEPGEAPPDAPLDERTWEGTPSEAPPAEPPPPPAPRPTSDPLAPTRADGLVYPVSTFVIEYAKEHPDHPPVEELLELEVELTRSDQGYLSARPGAPTEHMRIGRPADSPPAPFFGSAIRAVGAAIVEEYNRRGLVGALVIPSEEDVDARSSRDLRPPERTPLRLVVWTGHLAEQRTFASGARYPEDERVDNPAHAGIKARSPIQPGDLLDKQALDEYVARLNRHPGRNVDVAITRASQPGNVYLDYLVAENPRPFSAYVQVSDTGTEGTGDWRQRFGVSHTQLTGNDDVFQFDYITSSFDELNAVFGSYELPLGVVRREMDRVRLRTNGSWSQFDASEIGFQNAEFEGEQWHAGGQLIVNVYQRGSWFLDAFTGARYQHVENENRPLPGFPQYDVDGEANFFFPELGMRLEHRTDTAMFLGGVSGEVNVPAVAGTRRSDLDNDQMGRTNVTNNNFQIVRWQANTSFYLEPLFARADDPSSGIRQTRASEIFIGTQGQFSDDRLIPYHQGVAGGLNTVRGYPQSKVAGDTVALWRAEFRLHLPRLLRPDPEPIRMPWGGTFYARPPQAYGQPDWDFIVRPFVDGATVFNNHHDSGAGEESRLDLVGAGIGVELQLFNNLIIRTDWGRAQVGAADTSKGHDSVYFSFTFMM